MTNKEASFVLGAYPLNGAADPEFAGALARAGSDPALKAWFEDQRRFDAAIAARLQSVAVPPDLRSRIVTGGRVSLPAPGAAVRRLWAIAAMVAIFAGVGLWFTVRNRPEGWEDQALAALSELVSGQAKFDDESPRVSDLQRWLRDRGAPGAGAALPASLRGLASLGCKTISWNGHPISIICFHGPGGEMVHLAMMDRAALESPPPEGHPAYGVRDGWQTASWSQGGTAMMLVTRAPESQLRVLLGVTLPF